MDEELKANVLALEASLRDMEAGETGRLLEEFDAEFGARHGLNADGISDLGLRR